MADSGKRASALVFTLLVLLGVVMVVVTAVNRVFETSVLVRDVADEDLTLRSLVHLDVAHAGQYLAPTDPADQNDPRKNLSRLPVMYWHPRGPVGHVLLKHDWFPGRDNSWRADARLPASLVAQGWSHGPLPTGALVAAWSEPPLGAVPLKAGALAAYARPFQIIDFYEPRREIVELSEAKDDAPPFTFIRDARARGAWVRIMPGAVREVLAQRGPERCYHALFVDTVRDDLDNLAEDLLTQEGMAALMGTVHERGVLGFHVSHRRLNVMPIVVDVAQSLKYACRYVEDPGQKGKAHYASEWVVVTRRPENLKHLNPNHAPHLRWLAPVGSGRYAWTDAGPNDRAGLDRR